jgi:flagellar basal body-associated protein FliL
MYTEPGNAGDTTTRARHKSMKWLKWWPLVVFILAIICAILSHWCITVHSSNKLREISSVTTLRPYLYTLTKWIPRAAVILLFGSGFYKGFRNQVPQGEKHAKLAVLLIVFLVILNPILVIASLATGFSTDAPFTVEAELTANDGTTYAFLDSSFLQAQLMVLGQQTSNRMFTNSYKIFGTAFGDWPRYWACVIRPAGAPENDYGQLYMNSKGLIVGIRQSNKAYMAYDTKTDEFFASEEIHNLSPFVLLDDGVSIHQKDIKRLIEYQEIKGGNNHNPSYSLNKHLEKSLNAPNPEIRKIAARILQARGVKGPSED